MLQITFKLSEEKNSSWVSEMDFPVWVWDRYSSNDELGVFSTRPGIKKDAGDTLWVAPIPPHPVKTRAEDANNKAKMPYLPESRYFMHLFYSIERDEANNKELEWSNFVFFRKVRRVFSV